MSRLLTPSFGVIIVVALVAAGAGVVNYPQALLDSIRSIELAEASVVVLLTTLIARRYAINYAVAPDRARLLPRHVVRLGVGVMLLTIGGSAAIISLIGRPFVWFASPILFPAFTLVLTGLLDLIRWLPHRDPVPTDRRPQ